MRPEFIFSEALLFVGQRPSRRSVTGSASAEQAQPAPLGKVPSNRLVTLCTRLQAARGSCHPERGRERGKRVLTCPHSARTARWALQSSPCSRLSGGAVSHSLAQRAVHQSSARQKGTPALFKQTPYAATAPPRRYGRKSAACTELCDAGRSRVVHAHTAVRPVRVCSPMGLVPPSAHTSPCLPSTPVQTTTVTPVSLVLTAISIAESVKNKSERERAGNHFGALVWTSRLVDSSDTVSVSLSYPPSSQSALQTLVPTPHVATGPLVNTSFSAAPTPTQRRTLSCCIPWPTRAKKGGRKGVILLQKGAHSFRSVECHFLLTRGPPHSASFSGLASVRERPFLSFCIKSIRCSTGCCRCPDRLNRKQVPNRGTTHPRRHKAPGDQTDR